MIYRVEVTPAAAREIRKLPNEVGVWVVKAIRELALAPRPAGVKKLEGLRQCYRIRRGIYRIVYTIEDNVLKIVIVTVGHRQEVYRNLTQKVRRSIQ